MIYSDRQFSISKAELVKLKAAFEVAGKNDPSWLVEIQRDALRSQISDIEGEIAEYELLKSGQVAFSKVSSLRELPRVLVHARIAQGLSQTDLAERLNMKPQQVQRYEATEYQSASLSRLVEVADTLDVKISESFEGGAQAISGSVFSWADANDVIWSRFPLKEMLKRRWFSLKPKQSLGDAAREFFLTAAGPQFASALHRKKVRSGNAPNEFGLLAWQAKVLGVARARNMEGRLGSFVLEDTWLSELVGLTRFDDGPVRAQDLLEKHGIALVIERHLPGTYLDGAAMLSDFGNPVVALTLRYDRLDNFWFVLFHELGHVFLHLFNGLKFDFFDEEDGSGADTIEREADDFALERLVPTVLWDQCLSRFALSAEAVCNDAERLGLHPSILAGRIRKERENYTILNELVGANTVRSQFEEAAS